MISPLAFVVTASEYMETSLLISFTIAVLHYFSDRCTAVKIIMGPPQMGIPNFQTQCPYTFDEFLVS